MTPGERLRARGRQYGRLAGFAVLAGIVGLALAAAYWMPLPGSPTGFRHIALDGHLAPWWNAHVMPYHSVVEDDVGGPAMVVTAMSGWVWGLIAILFLILKRPRVAGVFLLLGFLSGQLAGRLRDTDGDPQYVEATKVNGATAVALDALARSPAGVATVFHEVKYPSQLNDGTYAVSWGSADMFGEASIAPLLHYILAQRAYLAGDVSETRRHLDAIDPAHIPVTYNSAYRIHVMRDWVAARGHPATRGSAPEARLVPVMWHRFLSWGGLVLAVAAFLSTGLLLALVTVIGRRARRIDVYAARLAGGHDAIRPYGLAPDRP